LASFSRASSAIALIGVANTLCHSRRRRELISIRSRISFLVLTRGKVRVINFQMRLACQLVLRILIALGFQMFSRKGHFRRGSRTIAAAYAGDSSSSFWKVIALLLLVALDDPIGIVTTDAAVCVFL